MTAVLDWRFELARSFEPRRRRYASPLRLAMAVDQKARTSPALEVIDRALVELMEPDSPHDALMVFMPPQEGKSQLCSRRFPEWVLDSDGSVPIAVISYEQDMALRWGRDVKNDVVHSPCKHRGEGECEQACGGLHIPIRRDSHAAGRWDTPAGGGLYCVGVGGPLTGRPAAVLVIDDPVKDRAAAESKTIRDSTWDWWESVAIERLAPGSKVVLIQTRWHEDDLAGRILARPSPLKWRVLRIPAIADSPDDPLGRAPGEELISVRGRKPGHFHNLKATLSPYVFAGIYGQKPVAPEGNFFRRETFRYWRPMEPWPDGRERIMCEKQPVTLADCFRFITMDFAASTKTGADWTVASVWAITPAGDLILLDRRRNRVPDHEHFALCHPLTVRWNAEIVYVEQNWWSKTFVEDARNAGMPIAPLVADADKRTRAVPAAGLSHAGRAWFPAETSGCECGECEGAWLDEWCDELAIFPSGSHDDQVDTFSYGARVKSHEWTPAKNAPRPGRSPWEDTIAQAARSATGQGGELDLSRVPY